MPKIKYLGSSDIVTVGKGENFSGRLADPITSDVVWSAENNFVVDTDEAGLSPEAVELLLEDSERFKNVDGMKRIPSSLNERMFAGHKASADPDEVLPAGSVVETAEGGVQADDAPRTGASEAAAPAAAPTTTTGGSTRGRSTGGSTA